MNVVYRFGDNDMAALDERDADEVQALTHLLEGEAFWSNDQRDLIVDGASIEIVGQSGNYGWKVTLPDGSVWPSYESVPTVEAAKKDAGTSIRGRLMDLQS